MPYAYSLLVERGALFERLGLFNEKKLGLHLLFPMREKAGRELFMMKELHIWANVATFRFIW